MGLKNILIVISPIVAIVVFFLTFFQFLSPKEYLEKHVKLQEYYFVVTGKHLDQKKHPKLTVTVNTQKAIYSAEPWLGLYEAVEMGDSLVKEKNGIELSIYRNDKLIKNVPFKLEGDLRMIKRF